MKTTLLIVTGLVLTTAAAMAQSSSSRHDHTYSTHNYKHANKSAEARRWEQKAGTPVLLPAAQGAVANYKQPVPGTTPSGSLMVTANEPASLASRNYKTGHGSFTTADQGQYVKRAGDKKTADKTAVGE
ncbi:hypothetical protein [Spirosoma sp. 209]|uniref:hypothetical protein n=1 Tax=Spirosoma sp. 209 TaxID=1955701 RepID=UPI00098D6FF6|nr:hypothetical protein [Spirosoma sp. 209]